MKNYSGLQYNTLVTVAYMIPYHIIAIVYDQNANNFYMVFNLNILNIISLNCCNIEIYFLKAAYL